MDVDTQPGDPQRIQDLWFEDGNIVIQAGNSQFRVHRGILATRSPVFQDMLSFPQPQGSELVEGCPLVRLPDAEIEVMDFLKAIFIPEYFAPFPALTKFEIIVGCLRLSHKYEVDYLRRRALVHLSSGHRTTLSEWDSSTYNHLPSTTRSASDITSWSLPDDPSSRICVIQLAREVDALWILPAAFYRMSVAFRKLGRGIFHGTVYNGVPASLSSHDQQSFVDGQATHIRGASEIVQFLSDPLNIAGCESPAECARLRLQAIKRSGTMTRACASIPLSVWPPFSWTYLRNVCPACLTVFRETHSAARQAFWDQLPAMYGLPSWAELETMKAATIGNVSL
ncbi:hypothetical protein DFH09DRAFT_628608 [Mycena vulgaris]|nr:hypothetical protein DFH09DRAFT_628608 [Mycena vulgaris]